MAFDSRSLERLLQMGRQTGSLTLQQVNDWLDAQNVTGEVDQLLTLLEEHGIELIDGDAVEQKPDSTTGDVLDHSFMDKPAHEPVGDPGMHRAFLDDIIASPEDDVPRLIYADWLTEHGSAWGEFIRVQCALARIDEDDPRWDALCERARELEIVGWWEPLRPGCVAEAGRERGMIERVSAPIDLFLEQAQELFRWAPIRRLQVTRPLDAQTSGGVVRSFASLPELVRLCELDLSRLSLGEGGLEQLLESPYLANLTTLNLRNKSLFPHRISLLASTRALPRLAALQLGGCGVTDEDLEALLRAPFARQLTELSLALNDPEATGVTDAGLQLLAATPLPRLRSLVLDRTYFTAEGIAALAGSENLPALDSLNLGAWIDWFGEFHSRAGLAEALLPLASRLRRLDLEGQELGPEGAAILTHAVMPRLRHLNLGANRLGSAGLQILLAAPWVGNLRVLNLGYNDLDGEALRTLLTSPRLTARMLVRLHGNTASRSQQSALCRELAGAIRCRVEW
jgi:uncharacterized protein (TIGR02996 family)